MIDQLGIVFFGMASIVLVNMNRHRYRKWAPVFGMAAQPFWFYATWTSEQWGIFAISFVYAFSWVMGFYNLWLRPLPDEQF